MQYKTITLALIEEQPELYQQLRRRRMLLPTLELAIRDLQERLPCASAADAADPLPLDAAMRYLRRHTPPA